MTVVKLLLMLTAMSGITLLLILGVKLLLRKSLGAAFQYYIWLILVLRLCFPVLPTSYFSVYSVILSLCNIDSVSIDVYSNAPATEITSDTQITASGFTAAAPDSGLNGINHSESGILEIGNAGGTLFTVLRENTAAVNRAALIIYLSITLTAVLHLAYIYVSQRKRLTLESRPCLDPRILQKAGQLRRELGIKADIPVYIGKKSLLYGIFHPIIVISETELESAPLILAHELTHLKWHDNLTKLFLELLRRAYWFSPFVALAAGKINEDMELLCDARAVTKFSIRKDDYAMLLFQSVKMKSEENIPVVTASSMSTAGKSLIRRVSNLGGSKKPGFFIKLTGIILVIAIAAVCLTNPILALADSEKTDIYNAYLTRMADCGAELPKKSDRMTGEGFCELLYLTLGTLTLPEETQKRFDAVFENGPFGLVETLTEQYEEYRPAAAKYLLGEITPDSRITKEQAAFLMSNLLVLLQRDSIFMGGEDMSIYIPTPVDKFELERICNFIAADGTEENLKTVKKLNAFYVLKDRETIEAIISGSDFTQEEIDGMRHEFFATFPCTAGTSMCLFDPYSTEREINVIAGFVKSYGDYSCVPTVSTAYTVLPYMLPKESYEKILVADDAEFEKLAAKCYDYDAETEIYSLKLNLDDELIGSLAYEIWFDGRYTAAQMQLDHAVCNFDYSRYITSDDIAPDENGEYAIKGVAPILTANVESFRDAQSISSYALQSVYSMTALGVFQSSGRFAPTNTITFGDAAVMLQKLVCGLYIS